jgi:hypothetical protein
VGFETAQAAKTDGRRCTIAPLASANSHNLHTKLDVSL